MEPNIFQHSGNAIWLYIIFSCPLLSSSLSFFDLKLFSSVTTTLNQLWTQPHGL